MSVELDRECKNCGTKLKQHVSFSEENGRITTGKGFRLRMIDTQTKDGRKHKRGLDTLNEIKFALQVVVNSVKEIFGSSDYKKVLVVWDVQNSEVIEQAKAAYNIEIWKISDILREIVKEVKTRPYRDDVLRTVQLIFRSKI